MIPRSTPSPSPPSLEPNAITRRFLSQPRQPTLVLSSVRPSVSSSEFGQTRFKLKRSSWPFARSFARGHAVYVTRGMGGGETAGGGRDRRWDTSRRLRQNSAHRPISTRSFKVITHQGLPVIRTVKLLFVYLRGGRQITITR